MKELLDIPAAFEALAAAGKPAALATVIAVEGSAYRRPGARMLMAEDGRAWGGVSGGCLERDVARRGRGVIATGIPQVCRYDTADDEDLATGVATGCGGAVEVFIQPITATAPGPVRVMVAVARERRRVTLATVVRATGEFPFRAGDCIPAGINDSPGGTLAAALAARLESPGPAAGRLLRYEWPLGSADVFVERLTPPRAVVVFGGGPDVVPLVAIAKTLGWHVTVVAARPATGLHERFAAADVLHVTPADDPAAGVQIPADAAVVVMTHNLARDARILPRLPKSLPYVGLLGPRHRTQRLLDELPYHPAYERLFTPVGLDLGAETPEEIALSVVAEIQAVGRRADAVSLRDRPGPIHADTADSPSAPDPLRRPACPV